MEQDSFIDLAGIRINESFNEVYVRGEAVELSELEYQILLLLMRHPRKIFSAQNLYESVWNEPYFYNCSSTVMVHIRRLRVKIEEDAQNPRHIVTVWGKDIGLEHMRNKQTSIYMRLTRLLLMAACISAVFLPCLIWWKDM